MGIGTFLIVLGIVLLLLLWFMRTINDHKKAPGIAVKRGIHKEPAEHPAAAYQPMQQQEPPPPPPPLQPEVTMTPEVTMAPSGDDHDTGLFHFASLPDAHMAGAIEFAPMPEMNLPMHQPLGTMPLNNPMMQNPMMTAPGMGYQPPYQAPYAAPYGGYGSPLPSTRLM